MLTELRALWTEDSIMHDAVKRLGNMVADSGYIAVRAWEVCKGETLPDKIAADMRRRDRAVNESERTVRRIVVEHLALNPGRDLAGCLAVMIMAKDIERLGDHARNIFGVGARIEGGVGGYRHFASLDEIHQAVAGQFPQLERAVVHSDAEAAHHILEAYKRAKPRIKALQKSLFETEMSSIEAVNTTLLTRFYMRMNAHIGNAASGIVFPVEYIDFVTRGLREEVK
ncbi:MAG: phosphate uptake regulator PhoU [Lentisphaerae bacterium]|nr:phosphate uptake regulator PhoU [Lentisphaerota bacterium]